ncbi:MAG: hypothetical protein HDT13_10940 [Butyrivibrio sp.]|nr:hypothetical protein [Butyrivibrio sp.]
MKKRIAFVIVALAVASSLLTSGCGTKKYSYVGKLFESENTAAEGETQEVAEYKSLIEKYVSKSGEPYMAHNYMLNKHISAEHTAEEWLGADGKIKLPFNPDDIKEMDTMVYEGISYEVAYPVRAMENYYVPDEIAANATTEELAEIFISYGYNGGYTTWVSARYNCYYEYEHQFAFLLSYSNALEESLRRSDFAKVYYEKYMAETENTPEKCERTDYPRYVELSRKTDTLDVIEVLLAQPEAYEQLTYKQRETLVRRVLEREKQGEEGKLFFRDSEEYWTRFFACIAGELYLPADMAEIPVTNAGLKEGVAGAIERDNNPWLDTINRMKFTEEEQKILEKYFVKR